MIRVDRIDGDNWVSVTLTSSSMRKHLPNNPTVHEQIVMPKIRHWCEENGSDMKFFPFLEGFLFENPEDATLFALKWV